MDTVAGECQVNGCFSQFDNINTTESDCPDVIIKGVVRLTRTDTLFATVLLLVTQKPHTWMPMRTLPSILPKLKPPKVEHGSRQSGSLGGSRVFV